MKKKTKVARRTKVVRAKVVRTKVERKQAAPTDDGRWLVHETADRLRKEAKRLRDGARDLEAARGNGNVFDGLLKALEPALARKKADGFEAAAEWIETEMLGRSVAPGQLAQEVIAVERQLATRKLTAAGGVR